MPESPNERLRRVASLIGYGLVVIAVAVITFLLVQIGRGYYYDRQTGQIIQNGLILLDSLPGGAEIMLDGEPLGNTTPRRLAVPSGEHILILRKQGHREWRKVIDVGPSEVIWLRYPLLVPETIVTNEVMQVSEGAPSELSPDGRWLAVGDSRNASALALIDTDSPDIPPIGTSLPASVFRPGVPYQIQAMAWAPDNEQILLLYSTGTGQEFILVNRTNPAAARNLSRDFQISFSSLDFRPSNSNQLYGLSADGLRQVDVAGSTVSSLVASGVKQFSAVDDSLFYLQSSSTVPDRLQLVGRRNNGEPRIIEDNIEDGGYAMEAWVFEDKLQVAISRAGSEMVLHYFDALAQEPLKRDFPFAAKNLLSSPNGRFLLMQDASAFYVFDLEKERRRRFTTEFTSISHLRWIDDFYVAGSADNNAVLLEYDGDNQTAVTGNNGAYPVYVDRGHDGLYSIGNSAVSSSPSLHRSALKTE